MGGSEKGRGMRSSSRGSTSNSNSSSNRKSHSGTFILQAGRTTRQW